MPLLYKEGCHPFLLQRGVKYSKAGLGPRLFLFSFRCCRAIVSPCRILPRPRKALHVFLTVFMNFRQGFFSPPLILPRILVSRSRF